MRALERAYLRMLLDPTFADRLSAPEGAEASDLSTDEVQLLLGMPSESLAVERAGRQRHLWDRARTELPRTFRRAEKNLPQNMLEQIRRRLFEDLLWEWQRTLALPLYGQAFETATHVRDAILEQSHAHPDDQELSLLGGLARIEHAVYASSRRGPKREPREEIVFTTQSEYDLFAAVERHDAPAAMFRVDPAWWYLTSEGRIGCSREPVGAFESEAP
ncbi:hypothetical protein [Pendulispora albinea]|uniref:Uncharacterized protein n=1 Tax=Pendulispora albinea TaxID=2741071 RepID=A0ABZ2LLE5_9BACT